MTNLETEAAARRLRTAFDLHETGVALMRQNLRREDPVASEGEIERRLVAWLRQRPGAPFGDSPGRVVPWPRTDG